MTSQVTMVGTVVDDTLPATVQPDEPHHTVEAHLAPDDAEMEARITQRVEGQIIKHVEERMLMEVVMATAVKEEPSSSSSRVWGLQRWKFFLGVVLFAIVIVGGAVAAVLLLTSSDDEEKNDDELLESTRTDAPVIFIDDPLFDELRLWIAPTEQDLVPFSQADSAQAQALEWLRTDPITMSNDRTTETILQRYVLAVLFFSTSGRGWHWQYLSPGPVCGWNIPVVFDEQNSTAGVICGKEEEGDDETVNRLELLSNNLRGQLPWELILLTNLFYIDLDSNSITGSIPTRIGELSRLEYFYAGDNGITGKLPTSAFASTIKVIDLGDDSLSGSIPENWGTLMPNLELLHLGSNSLTGTIPANLGTIFPLHVFYFFENQITGSVDQIFCDTNEWTSLSADCDKVICPCCTNCCDANGLECRPMS